MVNVYLNTPQSPNKNVQLSDPTQPPGNITFAVSPGTYTITGSSASFLRGYVLQALSGSYAITGASASVLHDYIIPAGSGAYTITGASAALVGGHTILLAAPGSYTITGASANLVYKSLAVKPDIDVAVTPEQLRRLRARLAKEGKRRQRNFEAEAQTRGDLRSTLEAAFGIAEPEVDAVLERLPVREEVTAKETEETRPIDYKLFVDWPKLYDDRALMESMTRDLGKVLTQHIERQKFEREEDDLALLMMA